MVLLAEQAQKLKKLLKPVEPKIPGEEPIIEVSVKE